jgi:hypothetical protein
MHRLHKPEWGMEMVKCIVRIALVIGIAIYAGRKVLTQLDNSLEGEDNG